MFLFRRFVFFGVILQKDENAAVQDCFFIRFVVVVVVVYSSSR